MPDIQTIDIDYVINPDSLATEIARRYSDWSNSRQVKEAEWLEVRNYVFATDTSTTSNKRNAWANSTIRPKLTQIRDNLHANYIDGLFPKQEWFSWKADDSAAANRQKKKVIEAYIGTKIKQSGFRNTMSRLLLDYIDYGNCFATVEFVKDITRDIVTGEEIVDYVGPRVQRVSPFDIVFNPRANSFNESPKILRAQVSMGSLKKLSSGFNPAYEGFFDKIRTNRANVSANTNYDPIRAAAYTADGFGSLQSYYESEEVELLIFNGDIYDRVTNTYKENVRIVIADRAYIIDEQPLSRWSGRAPFFHIGWRQRPDNLYAMGPLENLIGLQYRVNHLENLRADLFDRMARPILKIKGDVEPFENSPDEKIYLDLESDVSYLSPDATALNADFQISEIVNTMEEMAGAPKQAMGIRTPGEKTAFEVDTLQTSAGRVFNAKIKQFEEEFLEPILNSMLATARANMDENDVAKVLDPTTGAALFVTVTPDDLRANGKFYPMGARHYAERATRLQNLIQVVQLKQSDPSIGVHLSGKELAKIVSEELGEDRLYTEFVTIYETQEAQSISSEAEMSADEEQQALIEAGV